jgi:hypothetical protein
VRDAVVESRPPIGGAREHTLASRPPRNGGRALTQSERKWLTEQMASQGIRPATSVNPADERSANLAPDEPAPTPTTGEPAPRAPRASRTPQAPKAPPRPDSFWSFG